LLKPNLRDVGAQVGFIGVEIMTFPLSAMISLIACHGGPADHFATYAEALANSGYRVQIYATGSALDKFRKRGVEVNLTFSLKDLTEQGESDLADQIAKTCSQAAVVITDVGHAFDIKIQKALARQATAVSRLAYYDNPEPYVPGGYSSVAAEVMRAAEGILFANASLATATIFRETDKAVDFGDRERIGIGYYPVNQAEKIAQRRKLEHDVMKSNILNKNGIAAEGKKVLVYFGGNNEEYFSKAFPKFLSFLDQGAEQYDLSNTVVIIQQHPDAREKNLEGQQVLELLKKSGKKAGMPKIIISDFPSEDAQVITDAAFYYQTSMGPQFVLAGIPSVQIGHATYEDVLVRNRLAPSVTDAAHFVSVVKNLEKWKDEQPPKNLIMKSLGMREEWLNVLKKTIENCALSRR
jgi:hypothetical protein